MTVRISIKRQILNLLSSSSLPFPSLSPPQSSVLHPIRESENASFLSDPDGREGEVGKREEGERGRQQKYREMGRLSVIFKVAAAHTLRDHVKQILLPSKYPVNKPRKETLDQYLERWRVEGERNEGFLEILCFILLLFSETVMILTLLPLFTSTHSPNHLFLAFYQEKTYLFLI